MTNKKLSARQNILWSSFGSIVDLGCQWLITVLIVRLSSSFEAAGIYSLATAIYGIFHPIAQYRMYTFHLSDVKREYSGGEYLAFNLITCGIAFLGCIVYSVATAPLDYLLPIALYCTYRLAKVTVDVLHAEDQRNERMDYIGISLAAQGVLSVVAFALLFTVTQNLNITLVFMTVSIIAVGLLFDAPKTAVFANLSIAIEWKRARHLLVYCFPIVAASLACSLNPAIPRQYLLVSQGEESLGIYAAIAAPVAIIQMGINYVYYPLLGYFAQYWDNKETGKFYKLLFKVTALMVFVGAFCSIAMSQFGGPLLSVILGQAVIEHLNLINPMIVCSLATAYMWFINDLLVSMRMFKWTTIGSIISLAPTIFLTKPLVDSFEMNGVSLTLLASCLSAIGTMLFAIIAVQIHIRHSHKRNKGI